MSWVLIFFGGGMVGAVAGFVSAALLAANNSTVKQAWDAGYVAGFRKGSGGNVQTQPEGRGRS